MDLGKEQKANILREVSFFADTLFEFGWSMIAPNFFVKEV